MHDHYDNLPRNILEGNVTDVMYLDVEKVDHKILLRKLHNIGIRGKLIDWIVNFPKERRQTFKVDGKCALFEILISGVAQGTVLGVLGPLLFILYVNDMDQVVMLVLIFCRRYKKGSPKPFMQVLLRMTCLPFKLIFLMLSNAKWAPDNNMELNESKLDLGLCYSYRPAAELLKSFPFILNLFQYETPDGSTISGTDRVRDLGVNMSPGDTWSQHINSTIAEDGRKMLGWVLSVFKDRSQLTMLTLFKSIVQSKLEYCCPLWDPSSLSDIKRLEQIQRICSPVRSWLTGTGF